MTHWLAPFASGIAAMISAALGFIGALVLVQAAWRTIDLRKQIIDTALIRDGDQGVKEAAQTINVELQRIQLVELNKEHRAYLVGIFILLVGFVVQFVHELAI